MKKEAESITKARRPFEEKDGSFPKGTTDLFWNLSSQTVVWRCECCPASVNVEAHVDDGVLLSAVVRQLRRITASQVRDFLVLCREKYMRAKSEPGE